MIAFKEVNKEEFIEFLENYPRELDEIPDDTSYIYCDYSEEKMDEIDDSIVAMFVPKLSVCGTRAIEKYYILRSNDD